MSLETATYISQLNINDPVTGDDVTQGADHLRLIKSVLQNTFPNLSGPLMVSAGGLLIPTDGTLTAPGLSFNSEQTLGFYRYQAGLIGLAGNLCGAVPIGGRVDFFGPDANIPPYLLPCDGQAVSRTTYAKLFSAIGTTWGAGDGSTTFNVPPLQDRFTRHRDASGLAGSTGTTQGPANLAHTHGVSGTTSVENAAHTHTFSESGIPVTVSFGRNVPSTAGSIGINFTTDTTTGNPLPIMPSQDITAIDSASGSINVSGSTSSESTDHAHTFSVTSGGGSQDNSNETRPLSATVLVCIRAF